MYVQFVCVRVLYRGSFCNINCCVVLTVIVTVSHVLYYRTEVFLAQVNSRVCVNSTCISGIFSYSKQVHRLSPLAQGWCLHKHIQCEPSLDCTCRARWYSTYMTIYDGLWWVPHIIFLCRGQNSSSSCSSFSSSFSGIFNYTS